MQFEDMPQSEDSSHEVPVLQQMITVNHNAYISSTLQIVMTFLGANAQGMPIRMGSVSK